MKQPLIKRAETNKVKGKTHAALIRKYNEAIENGYYGEAELIVYAFLEDRLRSFIYYSDLLDNRNNKMINDNAAALYGNTLDISNISAKITIIKKALSVCTKKSSDLSPFERDLKKRYTAVLKVGELKKALKQFEKWCLFRNEIVHGLFNKDLEDLRQRYLQHVKEGMDRARYIDAQVQKLKSA